MTRGCGGVFAMRRITSSRRRAASTLLNVSSFLGLFTDQLLAALYHVIGECQCVDTIAFELTPCHSIDNLDGSTKHIASLLDVREKCSYGQAIGFDFVRIKWRLRRRIGEQAERQQKLITSHLVFGIQLVVPPKVLKSVVCVRCRIIGIRLVAGNKNVVANSIGEGFVSTFRRDVRGQHLEPIVLGRMASIS